MDLRLIMENQLEKKIEPVMETKISFGCRGWILEILHDPSGMMA